MKGKERGGKIIPSDKVEESLSSLHSTNGCAPITPGGGPTGRQQVYPQGMWTPV